MNISTNNTSIPFHIAQAYGVKPRPQATPSAAPAAAFGVQAQQKLPSVAQRLVAAQVLGRVDFSGATPTQTTTSSPAYSMYRHPAEKNAVATAVQIGRSLDVSG